MPALSIPDQRFKKADVGILNKYVSKERRLLFAGHFIVEGKMKSPTCRHMSTGWTAEKNILQLQV